MLKKFFVSLLSVMLLVAIVLPSSMFAAASPPSITDVCTFEAPSTNRIYVDDSSLYNRALIKAECDDAQIDYLNDVAATSSDPSVGSAEVAYGFVVVKAVSDGSFTVTISAEGYSPVQYDFAVGDDATIGDEDPSATEPDDTSAVDDSNDESDIDPKVLQAINDLQAYTEQIAPLAKYEETAMNTYSKYRVVTSKTRKQAYNALNSVVIPNYSKLVYNLKIIKPNNADLAAIHAGYVKGAKLQLEGLTIMKAALYKLPLDQKGYQQANAKISSGRKLIEQFGVDFKNYVTKLQALASA